MSTNTYRSSARDREVRRLERTKIALVQRNPKLQRVHRMKKVKGLVAGGILMPLGLITVLALGEMFWRALTRMAFWRSEEFVFFFLGGFAWMVAYVAGWRPVKAYVFGHEMSHLIAARLFGGKIFDWQVTEQGGYVETNKSNTWITLAPYLVPFYSIGVLLLFGMVGIIAPMYEMQTIPLRNVALHMKPVWFLYSALGLTWFFHVTFTLKTLKSEQSDLERNGEFFSVLLIFLINVLLLVALFVAASPSPGFGLAEAGRCWIGTAGWLVNFLTGRGW